MPREGERCQTRLPCCQMHLRCLQGVKSDHLGQAICHMVLIIAHATVRCQPAPAGRHGQRQGDGKEWGRDVREIAEHSRIAGEGGWV